MKAKTLDDRERYLTLEILTSEMAQAEREEQITPTKPHQDKA
jgi:hypothetical protein